MGDQIHQAPLQELFRYGQNLKIKLMNALIEFILIAGSSFLLFMFLGYRDAMRKNAAKGPIASLLNKIKGWKYSDDRGPRGVLFRQPIWIKVLIAMFSALFLRAVYDIFFDFSSASETYDLFTGYMGWLLLSATIFIAIIMSYLWPNVKNKIVDLKDNALKKGDKVLNESKMGFEELREKAETTEVKSEKPVDTEIPKEKSKDKEDPNDIIKDYLD